MSPLRLQFFPPSLPETSCSTFWNQPHVTGCSPSLSTCPTLNVSLHVNDRAENSANAFWKCTMLSPYVPSSLWRHTAFACGLFSMSDFHPLTTSYDILQACQIQVLGLGWVLMVTFYWIHIQYQIHLLYLNPFESHIEFCKARNTAVCLGCDRFNLLTSASYIWATWSKYWSVRSKLLNRSA